MPPANISFRQRSKRRFVAPVVLLLLGAGVALYLVGRGGPRPRPPREETTPQVAFSIAGFEVVSEDKAPARAASDLEKRSLITFFTDYYQTAFVDPKKWTDPTFPTVAARFSPGAQATFGRDITSLTIGEGRTGFRRVEPSLAQIKLSVYFGPKQRPTFAVAVIQFRAKATTTDKQPVEIAQDATYRLERVPGGWKIFSYSAEAKQDTPAPSPSPTVSPSA